MQPRWILYEDQDIIVCHKAAGIATQTARIGQADMVSEVRNYLSYERKDSIRSHGEKDSAVGSRGGKANLSGRTERRQDVLYVGVVHRLDQPVEGVLVFAKNRDAAAELSRQMTDQRTEKDYYAIICGHNFAKEGILEDYLLKDGRTNTSAIVPAEVKGAKKAILRYEILAEKTIPVNMAFAGGETARAAQEMPSGEHRIALSRIRLDTGRHHQIRVQMSHAGMSLLGDRKYADAEAMRVSEQLQVKNIALCAYRLSFRHPGTGERMQFQVSPEGRSFQIAEFIPYQQL